MIGAFQGVGRNLVLFKAKAANWKLVLLKALRRKLEIDNAEGVHINFRHFRHFPYSSDEGCSTTQKLDFLRSRQGSEQFSCFRDIFFSSFCHKKLFFLPQRTRTSQLRS